MALTTEGWLENSYLSTPWLAGAGANAIGMQAEMRIYTDDPVGMQSDQFITGEGDDEFTGFQSEMFIDKSSDDEFIGMQAVALIIGEGDDAFTGMQSEMNIVSNLDQVGMQAQLQSADQLGKTGMQIQVTDFPVAICPKYLAEGDPWLENAWLAGKICSMPGMQAEMFLTGAGDDKFTGMQADRFIVGEGDDEFVGMQSEAKIVDQLATPITGMQSEMFLGGSGDDSFSGMQAEGKIETADQIGMQVEQLIADQLKQIGMQVTLGKAEKTGMQVTLVLYNITNIRFLCDFASRGQGYAYGSLSTPGNNWLSLQTLASGDLGDLNNLNTDDLEQRLQTDEGVITTWTLRCDTQIPQGAFVDTVGILQHNFSGGATVTLQASNDSAFSSIGFSSVLENTQDRTFYVAPTLPTDSYRYWQVVVSDPGNADNHLYVGSIVFGASRILPARETPTQPVKYGRKHFKDTLETEGYTNVSNDRAIRRILGVDFEKLDADRGGYKLLQDYFDSAKTDLKCLVMVRPDRPTLLTVFAKMVQLPTEDHYANDEFLADLSIDWDEEL